MASSAALCAPATGHRARRGETPAAVDQRAHAKAVRLAVGDAGDLTLARRDRLAPVAPDANVGIRRTAPRAALSASLASSMAAASADGAGNVCAAGSSARCRPTASAAAVDVVALMKSRRVGDIGLVVSAFRRTICNGSRGVNEPGYDSGVRYDVVVIGGGHNGLTAASFLVLGRPQRARARAPPPAGGGGRPPLCSSPPSPCFARLFSPSPRRSSASWTCRATASRSCHSTARSRRCRAATTSGASTITPRRAARLPGTRARRRSLRRVRPRDGRDGTLRQADPRACCRPIRPRSIRAGSNSCCSCSARFQRRPRQISTTRSSS